MTDLNTNIINVAFDYLYLLNVSVTKSSLEKRLLEHPNFPSLYSIIDVFEKFKIETKVFKIDSKDFSKLQAPFIADIRNSMTGGTDFRLVTFNNHSEVFYLNENRKVKKTSKDSFLKVSDGIILKIFPNQKSGEKDYDLSRRSESKRRNKTVVITIAGTVIFLFSIYFFLHSLSAEFVVSAALILLIKTLGLGVTALLLAYEVNKSDAFVKSICTPGKRSNCTAVLQNRAFKIFGISWSESGFFYFASTFLFVLFPGILFSIKILVLALANCITVPLILYSVYYQWKVVKQWCMLCLSVQIVLIFELIWSILNFWKNFYTRLNSSELPLLLSCLLQIVYCLLLPITIWYILKPIILKAKKEPVYRTAYKRLLYNTEIFNYFLQKQDAAPIGYENMGINVGNPTAENTIIKVSSPFCVSCANSHSILNETIYANKNVKLKVIFAVNKNRNNNDVKVANHLISIYKNNNLQIEKVLDDWYLTDKFDYERFTKKYPINEKIKNNDKEIEKMSEWCVKAGITVVPTFFINGRKLPDNYKIEELKHLL